ACADRWRDSSEAGSEDATARASAGLWYEDNNMGMAGGMPPDFKEKFYRPDLWAGAREAIDVYYVRATTLLNPENDLDDSFLERNFVPVLEESGVEIALDAVGANFLRARPTPADERIEREVSLVEKLETMGGRVGYVALQSVLSKPLREEGRVVEYPMQQRIEDVVEYAKTARERLPDVEVGIIDALPTKGLDYREPYGRLVAALSEEDLELSFVHLDCPYEHPQEGAKITWEGVKEAESFVKEEIGARFGFICTSRTGGEASDEAWNDNVLDAPRQYASVDGSPDEYVVMSWFPHPGSTIPESAESDRFPDTKTLLSFARELET
ncbi:MAG: hypothetical protein LC781_18990, partial [Actinobacteria bacterium]|nr:hypothetical protein [Actinomycetota bacterium]